MSRERFTASVLELYVFVLTQVSTCLYLQLPNRRGSEQAVQSIIGEVFDDVTFDEFERSPVSSCSCTLALIGT